MVENKEARVLGPTITQEQWPEGFNGVLVLKPGINVLDEAVWEKACKTKFVKRRLGKTLIERGKIEDKGLAKTPILKALELVKGTYDIKQLEEWLESETRAKIGKAIVKQLEILNKGRRGPEE